MSTYSIYDLKDITPIPYMSRDSAQELPTFSYFGPPEQYLLGAYKSELEAETRDSTSAIRQFKIRSITEDFYRASSVFTHAPVDEMVKLAPFYPTDSGFLFTPYDVSLSGIEAEVPGVGPDTEGTVPRMEGNLFRKTIRIATIGLPTTERGFLNTDESYINRIQQRYIKFQINPSSGGSDLRKGFTHSTNYNLDFGFDNDGDGVTFYDYYDSTEGYRQAPWITMSTIMDMYARQTRFRFSGADSLALTPEIATLIGFFSFGSAFDHFGLVAGTGELDHSIFDDGGLGLSEASGAPDPNPFLNPLTEELYSHRVRPLNTSGFFYESVTGGSSLALYQLSEGGASPATLGVAGGGGFYGGFAGPDVLSAGSFDQRGGGSKVTRFYPKMSTIGEIIVTDSEAREYKVDYYYYGSGDGSENVQDLRNRFKTVEYVTNFSNQFIEHKIDQVAALLTTTVTREADIKVQKNSALNYNLTSAMTDDFTNIEAPDTSVAVGTERGADATRPRTSMRPAARGMITSTSGY